MDSQEPLAPTKMSQFQPLWPAEQDLCAAVVSGGIVRPRHPRETGGLDTRHVRATFLRYLATDKDEFLRVHESGFGLEKLKISGPLDLSGCELRRSVRFVDCELEHVKLTEARLATLSFRGGQIDRIDGDRCAAGALFLRGVKVLRGVVLSGARVAGDLDCSGSTLIAKVPDPAGQADGAELNAALALDAASIGGALFMRDAKLTGSLIANSLVLGKMLDADRLAVTSGTVALSSATLGGDVRLRGCTIVKGASAYAESLQLEQARIAGTLHLAHGFEADERVELSDLRIAGNLNLRGARFVGDADFALSARRLQVEGALELDAGTCFGRAAADAQDEAEKDAKAGRTPKPVPKESPAYQRGAALDLGAATVGALSDQWARWPRGSRLLGFRYKALIGATSTRPAWWVNWLKLQPEDDLRRLAADKDPLERSGFKPQPWDQAILALRAASCTREAEDVSIAKETAEHAHDRKLTWPLHRLWGVCAGYGYRPLRLLWALPVVYLASVGVYSGAADAGAMAPTKEELVAKDEYQRCHPEHGGNWARCALAPAYPDFNAWGYALQVLLPAIELRQSKDWAPVRWQRPVVPVPPAKAASGAASAASVAQAVVEAEPLPPISAWGRGALYWSWFEGALGLAAPVLVGLALTGLIRRKLKD